MKTNSNTAFNILSKMKADSEVHQALLEHIQALLLDFD